MTLSNWLDNELGGAESARIRAHLDECRSCRERVIAWFVTEHSTADARFPSPAYGVEADGVGDISSDCVDPETLTAYSEGQLAASSGVEQHVRTCAACTSEVQRLIRLRIAVGETAVPASTPTPTDPRRRVDIASVFRDQLRVLLAHPVRAAGALAVTAALLIVVAQTSFRDTDQGVLYRGRGAHAELYIAADEVPAYARPAESEPLVAMLPRGTAAVLLEERGRWSRIELTDGRRVWVGTEELAPTMDNAEGE